MAAVIELLIRSMSEACHEAWPPRKMFWNSICGTILPPWKIRSSSGLGLMPGAIAPGFGQPPWGKALLT